MKKTAMLLAVVFVCAMGAFAQSSPNFAGTWKLDTSKLDEQRAARIESQTITVEQSATEIKSTTATVRKTPPAGGGGQGGGGGRGGFGGGDGTMTYKLDGSEVTTTRDTPNGSIPTKTTAKIEGGKLIVSSSTTITGQDGTPRTFAGKSTWELSGDGKTLTVKQTRTTQNGDMTTESVYMKS